MAGYCRTLPARTRTSHQAKPGIVRKVLVKGIGIISALGLDRVSSFDGAFHAKSAISAAPPSVLLLLPNALSASVPQGFPASETAKAPDLKFEPLFPETHIFQPAFLFESMIFAEARQMQADKDGLPAS